MARITITIDIDDKTSSVIVDKGDTIEGTKVTQKDAENDISALSDDQFKKLIGYDNGNQETQTEG